MLLHLLIINGVISLLTHLFCFHALPQGFPRADVDVAAIRKDRHRHACLINDVNALVAQIAKGLEEMHGLVREQGAQATSAPVPKVGARQAAEPAAAPPSLLPFAIVDQISEGSPAASAGVQVG